MSAAMVFVKCF